MAQLPKKAFDKNVRFRFGESVPVELPEFEISEVTLFSSDNKIKGTKKGDSLKGTQLSDQIDGKRV